MVGVAPAAAEVSSAGRGERVVVRSDALSQDIRSAVYVVNRYWARHWSQFFPGWYDPPTVVGSYNGNSARRPVCAGQPLYSYNASYCMQQHFIAWDINLLKMGYAEGDAWVYQIIAHEWAHAVQNRVPGRYVSVKVELQADCLAGATLVGAARDGTLTWERSDSQEIAAALSYRAGDTPWTNPLDHGTARQRIDAFAKGARGGVPACFPGRF